MNLMHHLAIVLFLFLGFLIKNTWYNPNSGVRELGAIKVELQAMKKENQHLLDKNKRIEASIEGIKYNYDAREELARKHLGLIKKNETFFHITPYNEHQ